MAEEAPAAAAAAPAEAVAPEALEIYSGNKLFWKVRRTIDIKLFRVGEGALVLVTFSADDNAHYPTQVLDVAALKEIVAVEAGVRDSINAAGPGAAAKATHKEDPVMAQRRRKKEAEMRTNPAMREEMEQEARMLAAKERQQARKREDDELTSWVLLRLDLKKGGEGEAELVVKINKLGTDTWESVDHAAPPAGCDLLGKSADQFKAAGDMEAFRAKAKAMDDTLAAANAGISEAERMRENTERSMRTIEDLVMMVDTDSASPGRQVFMRVVRKALFQKHCEKVAEHLKASPTYMGMQAKMAKREEMARRGSISEA